MRIYLSGPMRGKDDNHFPEFIRIANILRREGHDVLNPAESAIAERPGMTRTDYLRHDIQLIMIVDAVVVIPDWNLSPGARFEVAEAWCVGIPVYEYVEHYKGFRLDVLKETSVVIPREQQYIDKVPLLGMSGFAGSGKDEVARTLVDEMGYTRLAFADPLKQIAKNLGWNGVKDDFGRKFLQDLGVSCRDLLDSDCWVRATEHKIEELMCPIVVTDVRFPNEVMMVRRRKGLVIRVERPGTGPVNGHISERAITDADADVVFHNDCSLEELPDKVKAELGNLFKGQEVLV